MNIRIGQGIDIHPFGPGSSIILGGVTIPHNRGLVGHSDADVLTHAIMDALLGAAGLPDIGHYFPNTDQQYRGASSLMLLKEVMNVISDAGYSVINCDSSIICESPKIAPHLSAMKATLASLLGIAPDAVGIKATTAEKLGSLGRGEGILVNSVVLLEKR